MGEPAFKSYYTLEDYLELQSQVNYKIAQHEGKVFSIAGGSVNHAPLQVKIGSKPGQALKNRKSDVFNADLNFYADASVICGKPEVYVEIKMQ